MLSPITLGTHCFTPLVLAPMAGVSDRPFRALCRELGAGQVVTEMVASDHRLWNSNKSRFRLDHAGETRPVAVQIVGYDAAMMADAARRSVDQGADIIDINMGCPAKKVCNRLAGSALMKDEALVAEILSAVVKSVDVPVTLKTRTGWDRDNRNGVTVARLAEDCGIAMLAIHGRTRADRFDGDAEFDTVADIKQSVRIPVLANGDIRSPESAQKVLVRTGCDGIMIGRGALGRPWIFREIQHFLFTNNHLPAPTGKEVEGIICGHLEALYAFYGEFTGLRFARKHFGWYGDHLPGGDKASKAFNRMETPEQQLTLVRDYFGQLVEGGVIAA